ncbi:MAG: DnaB-like helicase N-terminal domain-containing protein, partial [Candidatus Cloacimonadota bacterium]|nr:DnaB-like helicase N-terminal domain-containing protein [Candidatus Cloacimonadota bacterium]
MENNHNVPPQDINAEAAVISAMMIDAMAVSKAIEKLKEQHFYRTSHKFIFRAMSELFNEGIEIDLITVIARLEQNNLLEKSGTKSYLNEISDVVFTGANILY